jgi:hypothetical protein
MRRILHNDHAKLLGEWHEIREQAVAMFERTTFPSSSFLMA